jgi:malonyl-CoA/methylmalonyl-CoA synthetase
MAVPTIYAKLMEWYDDVDNDEQLKLAKAVSNLRLTVSGSAPLSTSLFDRWYEITGHKMLERYGMTETGMILSNPLDGERRKGAVGQPLPGVSVKLVDEQRQEISSGVPGEVLVNGRGVFSEYWRRPDETGASFHKGWFQTGDLSVEEDGFYRLLGRLNQDIIKTGGHKVSALEIEEVLREHPDINDATVVSIHDDVWGEIICAAVIPRTELLSDDSILEWCEDKFINHKRPRRVLIMNDFPRNNLGKVIKSDLREMFERPSELESDDNT